MSYRSHHYHHHHHHHHQLPLIKYHSGRLIRLRQEAPPLHRAEINGRAAQWPGPAVSRRRAEWERRMLLSCLDKREACHLCRTWPRRVIILRQGLAGSMIDRAWVERIAPCRDVGGNCVTSVKWRSRCCSINFIFFRIRNLHS